MFFQYKLSSIIKKKKEKEKERKKERKMDGRLKATFISPIKKKNWKMLGGSFNFLIKINNLHL